LIIQESLNEKEIEEIISDLKTEINCI